MKISDLTPEQKAHVHEKMKDLIKSDGWEMIRAIMNEEIRSYYRKISAPTYKPDIDQHNYDRGIIEGTYRLQDLPAKIVETIENDLKLLDATKPKKPEPPR